jgi:hypothetical protein
MCAYLFIIHVSIISMLQYSWPSHVIGMVSACLIFMDVWTNLHRSVILLILNLIGVLVTA